MDAAHGGPSAADIERELALLAEKQARLEHDGLWGYTPLPEVMGWLESPAKIRVLRGGNRCQPDYTTIWREDGSPATLADVKAGDRLLGVVNTSKRQYIRTVTVESRTDFPEKALRLVTKRGYTTDGTMDHPVYACPPEPPRYHNSVDPNYRKAGWVMLKDIKPGWFVRMAFGPFVGWQGDVDEDAYFHGLMEGDGGCYGDYGVMKFFGHKEESLCAWVKDYVESRGPRTHYRMRSENGYTLDWCNLDFKRQYESWRPRWSASELAGYLRGIADAEGCITQDGKVVIVGTDLDLGAKLQRLYLLFGIKSSLRYYPPQPQWRRPSPSFRLQVSGASVRRYALSIGAGEKRKAVKLAKIATERRTMQACGLWWDRIDRIEDASQQHIVGIKTSSGTYISDGIVSHNSSKTQTAAYEVARFARNAQISDRFSRIPQPKRGKVAILCVAIDYNKIGEVSYAKLFQPGQYAKYKFKCPKCGEGVFSPAVRSRVPSWMALTKNNARTRFQAWDGRLRCPACRWRTKLHKAPKDWRWEAPPLIPERDVEKISWADKSKNIPAFIETKTARISFLSGNSGREHFQGDTWDLVWIDEELGDDSGGVWSEIVRGTMDRGGRIIWSATPLARQDALIDLHERAAAGDKDVFESVVGLVHNHHIPLVDREAVAKTWPREQWRCRIRGEFFAMEGLVYPEFNREIHCIPRFDILSQANAKNYTFFRSIDPGLNVTAVLWFALDKNGDFVITDELHLESGNLQTLVENIREIDAGRSIADTTIDPSDQRSLTCKEGLRVVLARDYGIPVHSNFNRDIIQGIFRVKQTLIKEDGRTRPRLHIFDDLEHVIRCMTRLRLGDKRSTVDNSGKPIKRDDHETDALRYRIMAGMNWRPQHHTMPDKMSYAMWHYQENFGKKRALAGKGVVL